MIQSYLQLPMFCNGMQCYTSYHIILTKVDGCHAVHHLIFALCLLCSWSLAWITEQIKKVSAFVSQSYMIEFVHLVRKSHEPSIKHIEIFPSAILFIQLFWHIRKIFVKYYLAEFFNTSYHKDVEGNQLFWD